jgi:hypothetical protein
MASTDANSLSYDLNDLSLGRFNSPQMSLTANHLKQTVLLYEPFLKSNLKSSLTRTELNYFKKLTSTELLELMGRFVDYTKPTYVIDIRIRNPDEAHKIRFKIKEDDEWIKRRVLIHKKYLNMFEKMKKHGETEKNKALYPFKHGYPLSMEYNFRGTNLIGDCLIVTDFEETFFEPKCSTFLTREDCEHENSDSEADKKTTKLTKTHFYDVSTRFIGIRNRTPNLKRPDQYRTYFLVGRDPRQNYTYVAQQNMEDPLVCLFNLYFENILDYKCNQEIKSVKVGAGDIIAEEPPKNQRFTDRRFVHIDDRPTIKRFMKHNMQRGIEEMFFREKYDESEILVKGKLFLALIGLFNIISFKTSNF